LGSKAGVLTQQALEYSRKPYATAPPADAVATDDVSQSLRSLEEGIASLDLEERAAEGKRSRQPGRGRGRSPRCRRRSGTGGRRDDAGHPWGDPRRIRGWRVSDVLGFAQGPALWLTAEQLRNRRLVTPGNQAGHAATGQQVLRGEQSDIRTPVGSERTLDSD